PEQVRLRADRLGMAEAGVLVVAETAAEAVAELIGETHPAAVVVDSIQTLHTGALGSAPGSVGQVRESAALLVARAKASGVACFLIGHVTKEGTLAGPRVLEHLVDTVLYFEGDGAHALRVLRAVKNRFGSTNEVAVFEMGEGGPAEVPNPAADLAVVAAVASSARGRALADDVVVWGEVGLTGEVRAVGRAEARLREAARQGFRRCVLPASNARGLAVDGTRAEGVAALDQL